MQKEKDTSQSKGQEDKGGLDSSQEHLESVITFSEKSRSKTIEEALLDEITLDNKALVDLLVWID